MRRGQGRRREGGRDKERREKRERIGGTCSLASRGIDAPDNTDLG